MKTALALAIISMLLAFQQEEPPHQPHTNDPKQCTRYCYPKGGPNTRPKDTPEGIPGYECQGNACSRINEDNPDNEDRCNEGGGCTSHCAKVCCTCLAVCI